MMPDKIKRGAPSHVVADFNTLEDLIRHEHDQNGATHVLVDGPRTRIYYPLRRHGGYDEARVWQKEGYWHTQAPSARKPVQRLPENAGEIGTRVRYRAVNDYIAVDRRDRTVAGPFKSYGDAKQEAERVVGFVKFVPSKEVRTPTTPGKMSGEGWILHSDLKGEGPALAFPGAVYYMRRPEYAELVTMLRPEMSAQQALDAYFVLYDRRPSGRRRSKPEQLHEATTRRAPRRDDPKTIGIQYATDQLEGDHFKNWVRDQMLEAARLPEDQVLPLETKADAKKIARNMLQQLEWDTTRELSKQDIDQMTRGGELEGRAFLEGFRRGVRDPSTVDWLADELLTLKEEAPNAPTLHARRGPTSAKRSATKRKNS